MVMRTNRSYRLWTPISHLRINKARIYLTGSISGVGYVEMFSIRKNNFNMKFITMKVSQNYKEKKYSLKNHVLFYKTIK